MKAPAIEKTPASQKKKTDTKRASAVLAICPTNGAGWCPYPFTVEQLERKLKAKAAEAAAAEKKKTKSTK
jgi:hypothetical protein